MNTVLPTSPYIDRVQAILRPQNIVGAVEEDEREDEGSEDNYSPFNPKSTKEEEEEEEEEEDEEDTDEPDQEITLEEICEWVEESSDRITALRDRLLTSGSTKREVNIVMGELAKQYGLLEDMQYELDGLDITEADKKLLRKNQTLKIEGLFTKLSNLDDACLLALKDIAEVEKDAGNQAFKVGNFTKAIAHYSDAISVDANGNSLLYTNRALAYQKLSMFAEAMADARAAIRLDCNFLKAYVIVSKILLSLKKPLDCSETLDIVPLALQNRPEVLDLRNLTSAAAKELGNTYLKEGDIDNAIKLYSCAILNDPNNHLLFSNRSAAYQAKKQYPAAVTDAEACIKLCPTFGKGYIHLGRSQLQLKRWDDAITTCSRAGLLIKGDELSLIQPQLNEIMTSANSSKSNGSIGGSSSTGITATKRAEAFKDKGNECYRNEEYQDAVRFYSQAIAAMPSVGSYYGNRAAAWIMLKEFNRAAQDCTDGILLEKLLGEADKLRSRRATALAAMGKIDTSINQLEEAVLLENRIDTTGLSGIEKLLAQQQQAKQNFTLALQSLDKNEFTRAKRLFQISQSCMTDDPAVRLGLAKCHLGLNEYEDASREAQKVISAGTGSGSIEAYTIRADALMATGATDLAGKHLSAALQMDPDNVVIARKLKHLRKVITETGRIRSEIDTAMNKREYDVAVSLCGQGLMIDKEAKKLMAEMHTRRAKAYSLLAKFQLRAPAPAAPGAEEQSSPKALSLASWKRVLQDCNASMYYEGINLATVFIKCEALQALDKFEDAVNDLENVYSSSVGRDDPQVSQKLKEAKRLLKKSKRVNLYELLGCLRGEMSSEKEIASAYKKMALKWHPDRWSSKSAEEQKKAEDMFKKIGDANDLLTDPQRKQLYDEGYDREEIEQRMEMMKQGQGCR